MEYWIWLTLLKGIGPITAKRLIDEFGIPENIYNADFDRLTKVSGIGSVTANMILNSKSLGSSEIILNNCIKNNIKILTCFDSIYSDTFNKYQDMPIVLYYKGEIKNKTGIAIVGSRRCSSYGKRVVVEASKYLANNDIAVISGMAKGIDGYAHAVCLNAGGYTVAFLGSGLDTCYPKEHKSLMESIIENGAVISEYPPGVEARAEHFPRRNFLISSFSEKILVVEASKDSGTLITASIAKSQGKKVVAVPSEIYSITGEGTNQLIFNGAEIYLNPKQLLNHDENLNNIKYDKFCMTTDDTNINKVYANTKALKRNINELELKIFSVLRDGSKTLDEISTLIQKKPFEIIECITMLEIEGTVKSLPGGRYTIITH